MTQVSGEMTLGRLDCKPSGGTVKRNSMLVTPGATVLVSAVKKFGPVQTTISKLFACISVVKEFGVMRQEGQEEMGRETPPIFSLDPVLLLGQQVRLHHSSQVKEMSVSQLPDPMVMNLQELLSKRNYFQLKVYHRVKIIREVLTKL